METKKAIIMGAGPAGLAAGYELSKKGIKSVILEKTEAVGGIARTINYEGYRFDIGGHRFFTKNKEVESLWRSLLEGEWLKVHRLSRIYYKNRFFDYPLKPMNAFLGLGVFNCLGVLGSFVKSRIFPYLEEKTFEQWVSNRFGKKLYDIFFKTYTEKVWGIPCSEIGAEWAAQRIKGLSLITIIKNAFFGKRAGEIKTLIDEFFYPTFGPGMFYETMADKIKTMGNEIFLNNEVVRINHNNQKVLSVTAENNKNKEEEIIATDFISSIPITFLVQRMNPPPPSDILEASSNLKYRSILTVNLIVNKNNLFPDNWIYVHLPEVRLGRIQNYKNWSEKMVPDQEKTSLGLEYFCTEGDQIWEKPDEEMISLAVAELEKLKIAKEKDVLDGFVFRMPKAYPVYDQTYKEPLEIIKDYLAKFSNLQIIGRCGMYKYNNMDHSILTGLFAARNILGANFDPWKVNVAAEYLE